MKRTILIAVVLLAVPASAQANVTLDPGTKLTVVCERPHPFRGAAFTEPDRMHVIARRQRHGLMRRIYSDEALVRTEGENYPTNLESVRITVRELRSGTFRIRAFGKQAVTWRGC